VSVAHVVDVAQKLKFVSYTRDDGVQTIGDQGDLFITDLAIRQFGFGISQIFGIPIELKKIVFN
jgi:hypothetical protein